MQNNTFSVEGLFDFLNAGVSAFHSTAAAVKLLEENGYQNCPESAAWELVPGGRYYTTRNGSAVLAWRMPKGELTGWHVTASHSDSPTWRIKQLDGGKDAVFAKAETEGYGGMIMPTWLDRPLSVAGRILVRTENGIRSLLVHPDRALAVIPNLCIHFSHDLNNGMKYNPQVDLQPIFGEAGSTLRDALAEEAGVKAEDIVDADLVLCTREKAERVGLKGEYFMSGRIDDLECAYTTLWGFLQGRGEEEGRGDMWQPVAERRQWPRHPPQPPRKERSRQCGGHGRRCAAEVQCPPDLHHQRLYRRCLCRDLQKGRCAGAGGRKPRGCSRRFHAGQPAGPPDPDPHGGYRSGTAGHAFRNGDRQLQGCRVHGKGRGRVL